MTNENDGIDDDLLDYEVDMDVDLVIDEVSLLESEEDTTHETDTGLSLTTVVPTQPIQPSLPTLIPSTNVEGSQEPLSSILSNDNVLNESPTRPAHETAEQETAAPETAEPTEETFEFEHVKNGSIEENIASIDTIEPKTIKRQSAVCLFDPTQTKQSDIRDMPSSSSSTLSSICATNTMWGPTRINPSGPIQPTVHRLMDVSVPNAPKKNPFIIQAQSIGTSVSRTVLIDPSFDGFRNQNISKRNASRIDLSSSQLKKRKVALKSEEKAELPQSIAVNEEMSDEDKTYLEAIAKQKLKREEMLRLKEWRNEGWEFIE